VVVLDRAVFLDRDGVVNKALVVNGKPHSPSSVEEVEIIPGVAQSVFELKNAGFEVIVVTNQPDIARKKITIEIIQEIHDFIKIETGINRFYFCPHDDIDYCQCRKPKVGLITQAASDLKIDLNQSYLVGDRWKDITAGQIAGCKCFFIDEDYSENKPKMPYTEVNSLKEATWKILNKISY
jgi:D-glycero-D-manno-heptose 1,7-bisphosphate phosphatase